MRKKIVRYLSVLALMLGLTVVVTASAPGSAIAASCANGYTVTTDYNYTDWDSGIPVWRDTTYRYALSTGCRYVNLSGAYDYHSGHYDCISFRIWWLNSNSPTGWRVVCGGLVGVTLKAGHYGAAFMVESAWTPAGANVLY
jgi:hypothetical protein